TRRLRDKPLRRIESLDQRRWQVLARADRLRDGHLNGASACTRPNTGRPRRIRQRPLVPTRLARLIVRHADGHGTRAAPTSAIVAREGDVVDAAVTAAFPLSAQAGGRGADAGSIGTGVPLAHAVERLVLGDARDR